MNSVQSNPRQMTTAMNATYLNSLSLDELWVELIWTQDQPDTPTMRQAWGEILDAIERRQDRIDDWNDFLGV